MTMFEARIRTNGYDILWYKNFLLLGISRRLIFYNKTAPRGQTEKVDFSKKFLSVIRVTDNKISISPLDSASKVDAGTTVSAFYRINATSYVNYIDFGAKFSKNRSFAQKRFQTAIFWF